MTEAPVFRGTTILALRHNGQTVVAGDGQVSFQNSIMKSKARKVRRLFEDKIEELISEPRIVALMLIVTGIVLLSTTLLRLGDRTMADLQPRDSFLIGLAQALALIPGISRSGMTISAGLARGLERTEAARFAFLLGIPVIAGAINTVEIVINLVARLVFSLCGLHKYARVVF